MKKITVLSLVTIACVGGAHSSAYGWFGFGRAKQPAPIKTTGKYSTKPIEGLLANYTNKQTNEKQFNTATVGYTFDNQSVVHLRKNDSLFKCSPVVCADKATEMVKNSGISGYRSIVYGVLGAMNSAAYSFTQGRGSWQSGHISTYFDPGLPQVSVSYDDEDIKGLKLEKFFSNVTFTPSRLNDFEKMLEFYSEVHPEGIADTVRLSPAAENLLNLYIKTKQPQNDGEWAEWMIKTGKNCSLAEWKNDNAALITELRKKVSVVPEEHIEALTNELTLVLADRKKTQQILSVKSGRLSNLY